MTPATAASASPGRTRRHRRPITTASSPSYIGESLAGDDTVVLDEGMTFAVEPLIWVPAVTGGAGVRLEDTIVVEGGGGRPLTRTRFDARLLLGERPARAHDAGRPPRVGGDAVPGQ